MPLESRSPQRDGLADKLVEAIQETLGPYFPGDRFTPEALEGVAQEVAKALRRAFVIGTRRPRPRRETRRALMMRLPEVGVSFDFVRNGETWNIRVVSDHLVELREAGGKVQRFTTLKAAATAVAGYQLSISGWRFFFGAMEHAEVSARYGGGRK